LIFPGIPEYPAAKSIPIPLRNAYYKQKSNQCNQGKKTIFNIKVNVYNTLFLYNILKIILMAIKTMKNT